MNRFRVAFAAAALVALSGCDWLQYHFVNSIPFHGDPEKNPVVRVYLGVDGLSISAVDEARARGAFAGPGWRTSALVNAFPATSDYSWSRMFHLEPLSGYEYSYYDPAQDKIVNDGVGGLLSHIVPPVTHRFEREAQYLEGFDFRANGYSHGMNAYQRTHTSYGDTIDQLFYLLAGRSETAQSFAGYLVEIDVLGHIKEREEMLRAILLLSKRIDDFAKKHPERKFVFSLFSDHGNDNTRSTPPEFVNVEAELPALGVEPVKTLAGRDPKAGVIYAVPVRHTRVTYVALHTHPELREEVARRTSGARFVDVAVAPAKMPADREGCAGDYPAYGIWGQGKQLMVYAYDAAAERYCVPAWSDVARLDLPLTFADGEKERWLTDAEAFDLTRARKYPDFLQRVRTGLGTKSSKYPADVLLSIAPPFASRGIDIPGNEPHGCGSHGALDQAGTLGAIVTQAEVELPSHVRADRLLDVIPGLRDHLRKRGLTVGD